MTSAMMRATAVGLGCLVLACGGGDGPPTPTPSSLPTATPTPAQEQAVQVRWNQTFQHISGFGGSSAWHSTPPSDAEADLLFSDKKGAGLSLHRVRIAPDGTTWEIPTARLSQARGAKIWAAPWSPPAEWKSNGSTNNGGRLLPEHYQDWADRLADFALSMEESGFPLIYLSAQNEPGWVADWETCQWTPQELLTFIRDYLGPAVAKRGLDLPLLAPESQDWTTLRSFADPLLADPVAASYLGVIAVHPYGGSPFAYTTPSEMGKEFWETEWSTRALDSGMTSGLELARSIHNHLTTGSVNAYHYWWLTHADLGASGGLIQAGTVTKRLWVMGNYARFVRPGSRRIGAELLDPRVTASLSVSAYCNETATRLIIVAVNSNAVTQPIHCELGGVQVSEVVPWVTSDTLDLEAQTALPGRTSFSYDLPPSSVTTFVGPAQ